MLNQPALYRSWARAPYLVLMLFAAGGLAAFVALYPVGVLGAVAVCAVFIAALATRRLLWLFLLPALLPVVDLASWTGAIHLTESDALVMCALLVLGARAAVGDADNPVARDHHRYGVLAVFAMAVLAVSYAVSTDWSALRSVFVDPALLVGYSTPLNGVRIAKAYFLALMLAPFVVRAFRMHAIEAGRYLLGGLLAGAVLVALAATYERWAFVGLSNFSSDYRTTALFWEANVGGAMIDGWLALTTPLALWLAMRARTLREGGIALALLALLGYAIFTTFSRGLYLGVALGGAWVLFVFAWHARRSGSDGGRAFSAWLPVLIALLLGAGVAIAIFSAGGYRGLAALLGLVLMVYLSGPVLTLLSTKEWMFAGVVALLGGMISLAAVFWVPKGAYLAYGASFVFVAMLLWRGEALRLPVSPVPLVAGGMGWMAVSAVLVTVHWSEGRGVVVAVLGTLVAVLPLLLVVLRPRLCWRPDVALGMRVLVAMAGVVALVLTTGTYYAVERIGAVAQDLEGREAHWSLGAALPVGTREQWLGVGTGQYPERYFMLAGDKIVPGNHMMLQEEGNAFLRLTAARHMLGFGELYRVSQRMLPGVIGPFSVKLKVRSESAGRLHVELCRKHLLYDDGCSAMQHKVPAGDAWGELEFLLPASVFTAEANKRATVVFSVANAGRTNLDVDDISVIDGRGRLLVDNGDFTNFSHFWFFSSDRHHLPWHAKNLWLHYYVEQGLLGLCAFTGLYLLALWRGSRVALSGAGLMLPITGGLIGFAVVGLFDSLVDAPRLAVLFFILLAFALCARR